jgi:bifunctional DNA-binding transcriptional regulator/antitoxin component of YhaV-PrlF toxin-antitoxin module
VARINGVDIVVIENGENRIPIRPICEALGIAHQPQFDKIKEDEILGSTVTLSMTVGADGKEREMATIPYMYVFGWLFTINPKNVAPEAKETVIRYKLECYKALYAHFTAHSEFHAMQAKKITELTIEEDDAREKFNTAKLQLKEIRTRIRERRDYTFEKYRAEKAQVKIEFPEDTEVELTDAEEVGHE